MARQEMLHIFKHGLEVLGRAMTLECELLSDLINHMNFELLIKKYRKLDDIDIEYITGEK